MSVEHVVLLAEVELTTASVLRVTENAVASNLTVIDPSTGSALASTKQFYLRGDGSDDDLLQVLVETIQSHAGANTYTAAITWSTDPAADAATVTITRATGANNFQINWSHASTTIEASWFGFADSDTANDGNPKSGTLSPLVVWVSPEAPEVCEEHPEYDTSTQRARSGRVRGLKRGGPYHILDLSFALCDSRRVLRSDNTSDPAATFASFLEQVGDGTSFEVHQQTITGTAVDALTVYTRRREYWRFDEESSATFRPVRREPGLALYAWDLVAHGYGETQQAPAVLSLVAGARFIGNPDDGTTLTLVGADAQQVDDFLGGTAFLDGNVDARGYPDLVAAAVNGRDVLEFASNGVSPAGSSVAAYHVNYTAGQRTISDVYGGLSNKTHYFVLRLPTTNNSGNVIMFSSGVGGGSARGWGLMIREDTPTVFNLRLYNSDTVAVATHTVDSTTFAADDNLVVAIRHNGVTMGIRINDGAWQETASGPSEDSAMTYGYDGITTAGFYGYYVYDVIYGVCHTDEEADQNYAYLAGEVLGL